MGGEWDGGGCWEVWEFGEASGEGYGDVFLVGGALARVLRVCIDVQYSAPFLHVATLACCTGHRHMITGIQIRASRPRQHNVL